MTFGYPPRRKPPTPIPESMEVLEGLFAGKSVETVKLDKTEAATSYVKVTEGPLSLTDPRVGGNLNGVSDSSAAFDAAFALMPSRGGKIRVPAGDVGLTKKLVVPDNVTIEGSGREATVLRRQLAGAYTGTLIELAGTWSGLKDLTVNGLDASVELVRVTNNRVIMSDLNLQNAATDGLRFLAPSASPSAHGNSIRGIRVAGCPGIGLHVQGYSYDNRFNDIVVSECGTGVTINDAHTRWNLLHVWGCTNSGVSLRGKNTQFVDPFLETNGGAGIDIFNVEGTQILGGRLWRNGTYGATIDTAHRSRFIGVDMVDNQTFGLRGANSQLVNVAECHFYDTFTPKRQDRSISMSGTSDYWIIKNNVMRAADHAVGGMVTVGTNNIIGDNIE